MPVPIFTLHTPCVSLRPYISQYWVARGCGCFDTLTFPLGCTQILFHRGTRFRISELNVTHPRLTVSGQVDFPAHVAADGDIDTIAIVFRPHTIGTFIGTSPQLFYNMEIDGTALGNPALNHLADTIFSQPDSGRCIGLIERWLLSSLDSMDLREFHRIGASVDALASNPNNTVSALAGQACLGVRQFNRLFRHHVGMAPKEYASVVRFHKSLQLLRHGDATLAGVAAGAGYADQSHFVRECRRFSGLTPGALRALGK